MVANVGEKKRTILGLSQGENKYQWVLVTENTENLKVKKKKKMHFQQKLSNNGIGFFYWWEKLLNIGKW